MRTTLANSVANSEAGNQRTQHPDIQNGGVTRNTAIA